MKVALLISGGVDSSVALALLKKEGIDVHAFYLKMWLEDELAYLGECPWKEDVAYAEKVCRMFDVPFEIIPIQREYFERVVLYTLEELRAGRTPSPDIMCNNYIKFGLFWEKVGDEFTAIATGHYAQTHDGALFTSKDEIKDQTYFLAHLNKAQMARAIFPIGHLTKREVRAKARTFNLPNKDRRDSQGICFLGKLKYADFVKHYLGENEGDLIEVESGKKVGSHRGYWFYTIGQREGIGLSGGPWFVVKKNIARNAVFLSRSYREPAKVRDRFRIQKPHWIDEAPISGANLSTKIRHGPQRYPCVLREGEVTIIGNDQGFAPGQFSVFYQGERCLGAAKIVGE